MVDSDLQRQFKTKINGEVIPENNGRIVCFYSTNAHTQVLFVSLVIFFSFREVSEQEVLCFPFLFRCISFQCAAKKIEQERYSFIKVNS